jgi:hypothetical protein
MPHAAVLGQAGGIADLHGKAELGPVAQRLPMHADGRHLLGRHTGALHDRMHGGRIGIGQRIAGQHHALQLVLTHHLQGQEFSLQLGGKSLQLGRQQLRLTLGEIDQHTVDAIKAGA